MLHISILTVGFLCLLIYSVMTFYQVRGQGTKEIIPLSSFGVGLFGIGVSIGGVLESIKGFQSSVFVGVCWLSIVNGLVSCYYAKRFNGVQDD